MIGKIIIGKSFKGCINYCLEDKEQKEEEKIVKNRAELFMYNQCFGNKQELINQFNEVRQLNPKLSKPVLHITLSLAPEEKLSKATLTDMVEDCAKQLGFDKNQYIAIHHNDTDHQHIHIVANRVGFDGKTAKDNHNYQKIASWCRKMELKHELKQVLSPRRFLTKEQRQIPRHDTRKEQLKRDIKECLTGAKNYSEFEDKIKQKGYEIFKARGIAFRDKQKVYTKGSEVGYSLQTIEKILAVKPELKQRLLIEKEQQRIRDAKRQIATEKPALLSDKSREEHEKSGIHKAKEIGPETKEEKHFEEQFKLLDELIKPELNYERINPNLLKKKKSKRHHLHL
jgi:hypothetical protein